MGAMFFCSTDWIPVLIHKGIVHCTFQAICIFITPIQPHHNKNLSPNLNISHGCQPTLTTNI